MISKRKLMAGVTAIASMTLLSSVGVSFTAVAHAGKTKVYINSATGIAINGYDPVAYFTQRKPVEGQAQFSTQWHGATWHFSSKANKAEFVAMPEKYAPQYGGYCAFAVAYNAIATTVPEAWSIVDNKLYLNNSIGVRTQWKSDPQGYISKADGNWPGVLN